MFSLFRSFLAPLLSLALMMVASGFFNTFVSIRLEIEGYSSELIGIVTSFLYLGILLGSLKIDYWILKTGHIRSFILFSGILAVLALFQAFWINPWYWCALRLFGGVCIAGIFIVIESWMLIQSPPEKRGIVLSLYLAIFYAALSGGQFLINLSDPTGIFPFCIAAALMVLSILPLSIRPIPSPTKVKEPPRLTILQLFRISPLGFAGGVVSGMLLAAVYGLVPIYAKEVGMSLSQISLFMAVIIFGGFIFQWPFGLWADKTNRRLVLNIASFLAACAAVAMGWIGPDPFFLLLLLGWLFGGFSFALYPLSMAYSCENVRQDHIVAVTGGFVMSYGLGAISGPILAPMSMGFFGIAGLFYFLAAVTFILALLGLKRPAPIKSWDKIQDK